jgi:hypothetical protein
MDVIAADALPADSLAARRALVLDAQPMILDNAVRMSPAPI